MDRPQVITKQQLQNPPAEQTTNAARASLRPRRGLGRLRQLHWRLHRLAPPRGLRHLRLHHQRSADGGVRAGGSEVVEVGEGDFIYMPARLVRESVAVTEERARWFESAGSVPPSSTSRDQTRQHDGGGWPCRLCPGPAPRVVGQGCLDCVWSWTPPGYADTRHPWLPPCERQSGSSDDLGKRSERAADLRDGLTVAIRCCP